jgi:hypothetical protein
MDMEVKVETLFKNETAISSMFFGSEELVDEPLLSALRLPENPRHTASACGPKSLSRIPRLLKAQDFLLSIPSLQTNRQNDQENQEGRHHRKVRYPLWCFPQKAGASRPGSMNATVESQCLTPPTGQEDGSDPACPLHLHLLRQGYCQETLGRHLGLQVLQEDCCWWRLHRLVRFSSSRTPGRPNCPLDNPTNTRPLTAPPPPLPPARPSVVCARLLRFKQRPSSYYSNPSSVFSLRGSFSIGQSRRKKSARTFDEGMM